MEAASCRAGYRDGGRMEDVAVKQGFLYLQQQQTFGKVGGTRLAGAGGWGWGLRAAAPSNSW